MKKNKVIYLAALLLLLQLGVRAQVSMSLADCKEQALSYNKTLQRTLLQQKSALSMQKQARTAYLPMIDASASVMHAPNVDDITVPGLFLPTAESAEAAQSGEFSGSSDVWMPGMSLGLDKITLYSTSFTVEQPIYMGGRIRYANKQADLGLNMANEALKKEMADVLVQTEEAFWQVLSIQENIKVAEKYVEMLAELEEQLNASYELGLVPKSDQLRVGVQKNDGKVTLIKARNGYCLAQMALNQVIGLPLNTRLDLVYSIDESEAMTVPQENLAEALNRRAELKILSNQVELAKYETKKVKAEYLPEVVAGVSYSRVELDNLVPGSWNLMAQAQVSIPVFHWKESKHRNDIALFKEEEALLAYANTRDLLELEIQQVAIQLQEASERLSLARTNKILAEESLGETKVSFEMGLNSTADYLNAQADWQNAQSQVIEAYADYQTQKVNYKRVTGNLYN